MDWDAIGAVSEALGAFGVIVSLLYLGLQLQRSSRIAFRQIYNESFGPWSAFFVEIAKDPELTRIWNVMASTAADDDADQRDVARGNLLLHAFFLGLEAGVLQNNDFGDMRSQERQLNGLASMLSRTYVKRFWEQRRDYFHMDFRSLVDELAKSHAVNSQER